MVMVITEPPWHLIAHARREGSNVRKMKTVT
jgi:hypothetical protein